MVLDSDSLDLDGCVTLLHTASPCIFLQSTEAEMSPLSKKKDPSVTFLNKFGYNIIRLPRTGIEPLDVIGRDHGMQWLGPGEQGLVEHQP